MEYRQGPGNPTLWLKAFGAANGDFELQLYKGDRLN